MFTIRPFEQKDSEYEAVVSLENAVWPDYPGTIEEWKHRDNSRDPRYLFQRLVIEGSADALPSIIRVNADIDIVFTWFN